MNIYEYGNTTASVILIQPVDGHDLSLIEKEIALIQDMTAADFKLLAIKVDNWNDDLSPWAAPPVFGDRGFIGDAEKTLDEILKICDESDKTYYIGGYSLAGLFCLWAAYKTDIFNGVAAASPSVWFPGFDEFIKANDIHVSKVCLSLGDKEEKTRNPVMSTVGQRIRDAHSLYTSNGIECTLDFNPGNHFKDTEIRTAKVFARLIDNSKNRTL